MPVRLAVFRRKVCLDKIPCHSRADSPATHAEYVHVIIFDTLAGGEMIFEEPRASPRHFVGTYRRADSTTANSHASIHLTGHDGLRERDHEVGIIVRRVQAMRAEVHHLVTSRMKFGHNFFFESEASMIGGDSNSHAISLSPLPVCSPAAALSASSTALSRRTRPAGID